MDETVSTSAWPLTEGHHWFGAMSMNAAPACVIQQGQQLGSDRAQVLRGLGSGRSRRALLAQPREVGRKPLVLSREVRERDRQPVVLGPNQGVLAGKPLGLGRESRKSLLGRTGAGLGFVALLLAPLHPVTPETSDRALSRAAHPRSSSHALRRNSHQPRCCGCGCCCATGCGAVNTRRSARGAHGSLADF